MHTILKFTAASILALSTIAPALGAEDDLLLERGGIIVKTRPVHHVTVRTHRAADAYASANTATRNPYDFGIESQR